MISFIPPVFGLTYIDAPETLKFTTSRSVPLIYVTLYNVHVPKLVTLHVCSMQAYEQTYFCQTSSVSRVHIIKKRLYVKSS